MRPGPQLLIHPDAVRHNLVALKHHLAQAGRAGRTPGLWAVVKADAYGHGLAGILAGLQDAQGLALSSLADAYACRAAGWSAPILYMGRDAGIEELRDPLLAPLHVAVCNVQQIARLEQYKGTHKLRVWLRFAGELHHAGFCAGSYRGAYQRLQSLHKAGRIAGLGHMHHYAHAEEPESLERERRAFQQLIRELPGPVSSENSVAVLSDPAYAATTAWVRTGIVLYGINPLPPPRIPGFLLRPAMTLRAPIVAIQHLTAGETLGYGNSFRAPHDMRIALVGCGYADGYPRQLEPGCPCSIAGNPATVVGRVSMDTLCVDISRCPNAMVGDLVSLWGEYDVRIEAVAEAAGTIAAQLCTAITARVPRLYPGDPYHVAPRA